MPLVLSKVVIILT